MPRSNLKNNLDYKARRILVLGVSRTGKSTLTARLIHTHPAELILIYDWQGCEFAVRGGYRIANSREELQVLIASGERVVCYDAENAEHDPKGEGFAWFCGMAFEVAGNLPTGYRLLLVTDETQDLIDPYNIPDELGDVLSRGGRREIDTCFCSRSANASNTEMRDQMTELYCFRLVDKNSLDYPKGLGMDPERVKNLKDTQFIYRDMRTGEISELALWD